LREKIIQEAASNQNHSTDIKSTFNGLKSFNSANNDANLPIIHNFKQQYQHTNNSKNKINERNIRFESINSKNFKNFSPI
jgi:hypothetical protein